jgi:hypothetical protein
MLAHQRQQTGNLCQIELAVTVGVEHPFTPRGLQAIRYSSAISLIPLVMNNTNLAMQSRQLISDRPGAISAAIIDDHDFKVAREPMSNLQRLLNDTLKIALLIETRQHNRQWQRLNRRPRDSRVTAGGHEATILERS